MTSGPYSEEDETKIVVELNDTPETKGGNPSNTTITIPTRAPPSEEQVEEPDPRLLYRTKHQLGCFFMRYDSKSAFDNK